MNKVIRLTYEDFNVSGVIKNIPANSHIRFDAIYPIRNSEVFFERNFNSWRGVNDFYTYILVRKGTSREELEKKISGVIEKHDPGSNSVIYLQPLKDIHLKSAFQLDTQNHNQGNITNVYLLSILALSILFIACFNYMNLSTAGSADRVKGIAIRKVSGATRMDIIKQFLGEAMMLSFIALILAVILVYFLLPVFNNLSGKELTFSLLGRPEFLLGLIALAVVTGIISSSYPALLLSSFNPVNMLKGSGWTPKKKGGYLRKILVIAQFVVAIVLILATIVIYTQLGLVRTSDLGFNPHNVITFMSAHQFEDYYAEKEALFLKSPDVLEFCMGNAPIFLYQDETDDVNWQGKNPNERVMMYPLNIDYGYIELYQMKMVEGRSFSRKFSTDTSAFILNETAGRYDNRGSERFPPSFSSYKDHACGTYG